MADWYVSTTGNNGNSGASIGQAFASIQQAIDWSSAGDTVYLDAGVYTERLSIWQGGSSGNPFEIVPYPGAASRPVIDGTGSPANSDLVQISGDWVRVAGLEIRNATKAGLSLWGASNVLIEDNIVHGCEQAGIYLGCSTRGDSTGNRVEGNVVYNNVLEHDQLGWSGGWARGLAVDRQVSATISDNYVFENYGEGLGLLLSTGCSVTGNTVYDNYSVNIYLDANQSITVTGNKAFTTENAAFYRYSAPAIPILLAVEDYGGGELVPDGYTVTGNTCGPATAPFLDTSFGLSAAPPYNVLTNSTITPNTLIAASAYDPAWVYGYSADPPAAPTGLGVTII